MIKNDQLERQMFKYPVQYGYSNISFNKRTRESSCPGEEEKFPQGIFEGTGSNPDKVKYQEREESKKEDSPSTIAVHPSLRCLILFTLLGSNYCPPDITEIISGNLSQCAPNAGYKGGEYEIQLKVFNEEHP